LLIVGSIPYDSTDEELRNIVSLAGPFREFKLKTDQKTNGHKGFGFCEYQDPDVAASALRNLKHVEVRNRSLKVDFASEHKSGTNLRSIDVLYRDRGEVVSSDGGQYIEGPGGVP
jgi:cleavage stimulation factor subunit 2